MRRYDLAYGLIPYLISEFHAGKIKQAHLSDKGFFNRIFDTEQNDFDPDEFILEQKILSENKSVVAYVFPEPYDAPQAKFGLIFFDLATKTAKYYTLEKSIPSDNGEDRYMIGSVPELGTHANRGNFEGEATLENFFNFVYTKFENSVD